MNKQLKRLIIGIVGFVAIFWACTASAWTSDSDQRGWVDSIVWHTGFVIGPTPQIQITGWACLNPKYNQAATSTNVLVYQNTFQGLRQLQVTSASAVNRSDVVSAGACANLNNGFSLGLQGADLSQPNSFIVYFMGGFTPIILEGQSSAILNSQS